MSRVKWIWIVVLMLTLLAGSAYAGDGKPAEDPMRKQIRDKVKMLVMLHDSYRAIEYVHGLGSSVEVAKRYNDLILDFYWKEKSLPFVIEMGRAGIQYMLTEAQRLHKSDPKSAKALRRYAKVCSYNLASFTWIGWDEPGIVIKKYDMMHGLDAARVHLRLTVALRSPALEQSKGYWILAGQQMALENYDEAIKTFALAKDKAAEARAFEYEALALGFIGVAELADDEKSASGYRKIELAMERLKKMGSQESELFVNQIQTALKIFAPKVKYPEIQDKTK